VPFLNDMSQTQISSDSPQGVRKLPGVRFGPEALTSREIERAHNVVHDGLLKSCGIEPLVELLSSRGLAAHGLLGCVQVPIGNPVLSFAGEAIRYKKTVPVWVLETGEKVLRHGHSSRGLTYMNTKQFVSWLSSSLPALNNPGQRRLPTLHENVPIRTINSQPTVPLPSVRSYPVEQPRAVPLPSVVASGALQMPPSPPSYVSQLGDINTINRNPLAHAESEFQSVPRLDGGTRFDPDEYVIRIARLNEAREGAGLPPVNGVTPSTYTR